MRKYKTLLFPLEILYVLEYECDWVNGTQMVLQSALPPTQYNLDRHGL